MLGRIAFESQLRGADQQKDDDNPDQRRILWPQAEPCMDVDKPHQLEIMREDFASRQRKLASAQKKSVAVKKDVKPKTVPSKIKAKPKAKQK